MTKSIRKLPRSVALLAAFVAFLFVPEMAAAQDYAVVVNAGNGYSESEGAMREQVKRLFLKQQAEWPNGLSADAFARPEDSAVHAAFMSAVLGLSASEYSAHWARLKQVSGETPPRAVGSIRILLSQVARKDGAFGIIELSEMPDGAEGVSILFRF